MRITPQDKNHTSRRTELVVAVPTQGFHKCGKWGLLRIPCRKWKVGTRHLILNKLCKWFSFTWLRDHTVRNTLQPPHSKSLTVDPRNLQIFVQHFHSALNIGQALWLASGSQHYPGSRLAELTPDLHEGGHLKYISNSPFWLRVWGTKTSHIWLNNGVSSYNFPSFLYMFSLLGLLF